MIIGGSSGIGLAAAAMLREVGARVVLLARNAERLARAAARVRAAAPGQREQVLDLVADASDESRLRQVFEQVGVVDHVLVTAGAHGGAVPLADSPRHVVEAAVDARLWGAYAAARVAAERIPEGGSLTLSSGALLNRPVPGVAAAVAGIGAVEAATRAFAVDLADRRVRVNSVRYGPIDTPMARGVFGDDDAIREAGATMPLGRFGTVEEAASAALFLMSTTSSPAPCSPSTGDTRSPDEARRPSYAAREALLAYGASTPEIRYLLTSASRI